MLRELQVTKDKPANAMYKSGEDDVVITGMGVVKKEATGTFEFPASATAADIFLVDKERIATGYKAGIENLSDYDEEFVEVKPGEFAKLIAYYVGERFATDQVTGLDALVADTDRLAVGADGKWAKATAASKYIFKGIYKDADKHDCALIEVSDTAQ